MGQKVKSLTQMPARTLQVESTIPATGHKSTPPCLVYVESTHAGMYSGDMSGCPASYPVCLLDLAYPPSSVLRLA
jgi:hypothetical protein